MVKPTIDFICIGAQKAGTTWLYDCLAQQSDFSLPPLKELHYFDRSEDYFSIYNLNVVSPFVRLRNPKRLFKVLQNISKAKNAKEFRWLIKWYFSYYNDGWYLSLFNSLKGIKGEITPSYTFLKEREIKRMYELAPEAKLIFILRNPIDRAWSQFRYILRFKSMANFNKNDFEKIKDFLNSDQQVLRSNYLEAIKTYTQVFPKNQMLICFYDAIKDTPKKLLTEIIQFIGGESKSISSNKKLFKHSNVTQVTDEMPSEILLFLQNKYKDQIKQLAEMFESYPRQWLLDLEKIDSKKLKLTPTALIP